jgi:LPS-assembly protein
MLAQSHQPKSSRHRHLLSAVAALALLAGLGEATTVHAQTLNDQLQRRGAQAKGRLLVEAREVVYNNDNETVEARGDAQLYYDGRLLEADKVVYDRKTKRVFATGNAKLTEANGQVLYSDRFELTDDFRDGFIDSLRLVSPDKQRISAARGERTDGEVTVFERGTYTACESCKDNPEKPPLWQVKAARIIHKNSEQVMYYEDARLEFFGVPVAYVPFFSAPDPTVSRKSGLLTPKYTRKSSLGYGVSLPVYFALAPHYDLLWTPTAFTKQGVLNELEWRHRLETGVYNVRVSGILQQESNAFLVGPLGPNKPRFGPLSFAPGGSTYLNSYPVEHRDFRGSIETTGKFYINRNWTYGWDVALTTDKYFFGNYRVRSESIAQNYFKESISNVYLRGQTDRSFFDLSGFYFQGQSTVDWQKQTPNVHPVLDFNRRFKPDGIGGELELDVNSATVSRQVADYVALPPGNQRFSSNAAGPVGVGSRWLGAPSLFNYQLGNTGFGLYQACNTYDRSNCLLRGMAGTNHRTSLALSWKRNFIDPLGQVWTPFISARADFFQYNLDTTSTTQDPYRVNGNTIFGNDKQSNYLQGNDTAFRAMPSVGFEYRYPFVGSTGNVTHLFEPIAQVVVRPNETKIGKLPNEDSQSLVFSDSNLFSLNKFSGYDRSEGGSRANLGVQYTATFAQGSYINALVGQSIHLGGRNSFAAGSTPQSTDLVNTGLDSGLETRRSDYVSRFTFSPDKTMSFTARGRFDEESFKLKRLDLASNFEFGPVATSIIYTRLDAQPDLGFVRRREGMNITSRINLQNNWFVTGSLLLDLDRYLYDRDLFVTAAAGTYTTYNKSPFRPSGVGLGLGYVDECTTLTFNYVRAVADNLGATRTTNNTFLFRLELKHLGQVRYSQTLQSNPSLDGTR